VPRNACAFTNSRRSKAARLATVAGRTRIVSEDALRILIVSSVGGHLTELMLLRAVLEPHEVVLVVNDAVDLPPFPFARVHRIAHAERDWRVLQNMGEAARILTSERPDAMLSAGAGCVVPFALWARAIGIRVVYIESASAVTTPTLTGRLMYRLADRFFIQSDELRAVFPKAQLVPIAFA
jgi:UDP-N-acetylglucosamine:LPS N-acetylglucosamine transferase